MTVGCKSITPLPVSVTVPANLAQDCDSPDVMVSGDSLPQALINNTAKLKDCQEKHKKLAEFCGAS